jgi:hypothetical protein
MHGDKNVYDACGVFGECDSIGTKLRMNSLKQEL